MDKKLKDELLKEFQQIGYGLKTVSRMSKQAQDYIRDRNERGVKELKIKTKTGNNGYTPLLGVWKFTKSAGVMCAVGKKRVWMATILNNELI